MSVRVELVYTGAGCYEGKAGALGLTEDVKVNVKAFASGKGTMDLSGSGIEKFTCADHAFTKSGQEISVDVSDCVPSAMGRRVPHCFPSHGGRDATDRIACEVLGTGENELQAYSRIQIDLVCFGTMTIGYSVNSATVGQATITCVHIKCEKLAIAALQQVASKFVKRCKELGIASHY